MKGFIEIGKVIKRLANGATGINGKVYPIEAPSGLTLPYVVYRRQSTQVDSCKDSDGCGVSATVEVTLLSDSYDRSVALAENLNDSLDGNHVLDDIGNVSISLMDSSEDKAGDIYAQYFTYRIYID